MFQSARIKLTAWYLLIIMTISLTFSLVIYLRVNRDLMRLERIQQVVRQQEKNRGYVFIPNGGQHPLRLEPEMIREVRIHATTTLLVVNTIILFVSGLAGYFLAGRTLRPIQEMVDEQSRFITDASHELRTPLTALKSELEVNLRDKNLTLRDAKNLLESNLEEVDNLQHLSDTLLELTQYPKSEDILVFESISLETIINQAIKKVTSIAKKKHITLRSKILTSKVQGDQPRLIELLVILLENAIKYSRPNTSIKISTERKTRSVVIAVHDNGDGIHKEDIPHIFDRFYRAHESRTKRSVKGYGLGLSIAKKIVELHHGTIAVESKDGRGTTFYITLPLS